MNRTLLGSGALSWNGSERRSDRYGVACLYRGGDGQVTVSAKAESDVEQLAGRKGKLVAVIRQTGKSHHLGDLFRGIGPPAEDDEDKVKVGEEVLLGEGTLFFADGDGWAVLAAGLRPSDGRQSDWLDPVQLYRCHDQAVDLYFDE